jgi:hypothetical protein
MTFSTDSRVRKALEMRPMGALYPADSKSQIDSITGCSFASIGIFLNTRLLTFGS